MNKQKMLKLHNGRKMNRYGTRDQIPNDKRKIVCLGCSHTYGYKLSPEQSWPFKLSQLIEDYQVLNMGVPAFGLKLNIKWFKYFARDLNPKICIIQPPIYTRQPYPGIQEDILGHYTMNQGSLCLVKSNLKKEIDYLEISQGLVESDFERFCNFISLLKEKRIIPIVLIYVPNTTFFYKRFIEIQYQKIHSYCLENSIVCTDKIYDRFLDKKSMLSDRTHPNEKGNEFLAKNVYKVIENHL